MTAPQRRRNRRGSALPASDDTTRQRFGHVTDRKPSGSGPGGQLGTYYVRDDETGITYSFSYADIVTEGFRTIRTGERVRFLVDPDRAGCAVYVIRLDLPDIEDFYS